VRAIRAAKFLYLIPLSINGFWLNLLSYSSVSQYFPQGGTLKHITKFFLQAILTSLSNWSINLLCLLTLSSHFSTLHPQFIRSFYMTIILIFLYTDYFMFNSKQNVNWQQMPPDRLNHFCIWNAKLKCKDDY
jgi:hypothetical protein